MQKKTSHRSGLQIMITTMPVFCLMMGIGLLGAHAGGGAGHPHEGQSAASEKKQQGYTLLPTHRVISGVVEEVSGDQAKVSSGDTGEISPRYLSLERAKEKGFTLKQGDKLDIVVNAKNHVVDYHLKNGAKESDHRVIKGHLAQPLKVGQEQAIIKTQDDKKQSFPVRPLARSEVAAIPFDTEALFLIDETNKIASATLAQDVSAERDWARSSAYNVYRHIEGSIEEKPNGQTLTIKTKDDQTISLPVWEYLQDEMKKLSEGMQVTLLVDRNEKVVDIAFLPQDKS
jgi:hypothetical protein